MTQPSYLTGRRNVHDSPWTAERDAILARLWTEGYSASQIAAQITDIAVSRMAVIGRVHRLKLPARKPRQRAVRKGQRYKPRQFGKHLIQAAKEAVAFACGDLDPKSYREHKPPIEPKMRRLTLLELKPTSCRWPIGEGPFLFCGADAASDEVYCPFHQRIARVRDKRCTSP